MRWTQAACDQMDYNDAVADVRSEAAGFNTTKGDRPPLVA